MIVKCLLLLKRSRSAPTPAAQDTECVMISLDPECCANVRWGLLVQIAVIMLMIVPSTHVSTEAHVVTGTMNSAVNALRPGQDGSAKMVKHYS